MTGWTGTGFVIYKHNKTLVYEGVLRLPDESTVFQVEVTAVERAVLALLESHEHLQPKFVKFCSAQCFVNFGTDCTMC